MAWLLPVQFYNEFRCPTHLTRLLKIYSVSYVFHTIFVSLPSVTFSYPPLMSFYNIETIMNFILLYILYSRFHYSLYIMLFSLQDLFYLPYSSIYLSLTRFNIFHKVKCCIAFWCSCCFLAGIIYFTLRVYNRSFRD